MRLRAGGGVRFGRSLDDAIPIPGRMSAEFAAAPRAAPRFRYFLPHSLVARRMLLLTVPVWAGFRICVAVVRSMALGNPRGAAALEAPVGDQAMVWIGVTAVVTGAVMIHARRRGTSLLLANLGSPPAATAGWIAALVTVLEWGTWWLLR